jgi:ribosomal RNA-processing protein 12
MVIREGDVVDFLDQKVVRQLANASKPKKKSKEEKHRTDENGKLVFEDSDEEMTRVVPEISEDYYKQSLASEVAFTRTADGKVKFVKNKKRTLDQGEEIDPNMGQRWTGQKKKAKGMDGKELSKMLGRQYKAKKAGGDVKRPGMDDPYAYIPLNGKIVGNM